MALVADMKTMKSLTDMGITDLPVNYVKDEDGRPVVAYNDLPVKSLSDMGIKDLPVKYVMDQHERPVVAYNDFSKGLPVISLANARASGAERAQLLKELRAACEEWGIFQLKDHGVPKELNSQILCGAEEFFSLSVEEKMQYATKAGQFEGYGNGGDWREIYFAMCSPAGDTERWPAKPVQFREALAKYSDATLELAKTLLGLISELLGVEADAIEKACGESELGVLFSYYPTCPRPDLALGLRRHTDPGTLTILLQDKVGGLQATKDDGKTWVTVEPIEGAFVVNVGDQLHVLSNGILKSADHQAVVNSNVPRQSIATFYSPHPDSVVYPLDALTASNRKSCFEHCVYSEFFQRKKQIKNFLQSKTAIINRNKGISSVQQSEV